MRYPGGQIHGTASQEHIAEFKRRLRFLRWLFVMLVAVTVMLGFSLCPALAATPSAVIKMSDKPPKFLPPKVTIKAGQTVEWINNAKTLHSVDGDPSMALKPSDVSLPPGAKPFDSGFMKPDMNWEYTFKIPGTYKYTCVPHEKDRMNGEVVVK